MDPSFTGQLTKTGIEALGRKSRCPVLSSRRVRGEGGERRCEGGSKGQEEGAKGTEHDRGERVAKDPLKQAADELQQSSEEEVYASVLRSG